MESQKYSSQNSFERTLSAASISPKNSANESELLLTKKSKSHNNNSSVVPSSDTIELTQGCTSNISHLISLPETSSFYLDDINLENTALGLVEQSSNENMLGLTNLNFVRLQHPIRNGISDYRDFRDEDMSSVCNNAQRKNNYVIGNNGDKPYEK